jgi:IS5 family transposase
LWAQVSPELGAPDVLHDDDQPFGQVKSDLARRFPHTTDRGRHSTPVEAILRLMLVKHLHSWSFQETEECVAESPVLRWSCRWLGWGILESLVRHIAQAKVIRSQKKQAAQEK